MNNGYVNSASAKKITLIFILKCLVWDKGKLQLNEAKIDDNLINKFANQQRAEKPNQEDS